MDENSNAGRQEGSGNGIAYEPMSSHDEPLVGSTKVVETPRGVVHFSKSAPGLELRHQSSGTSQDFKHGLVLVQRQSMPCIREQHLAVIRETEEDDECGGKQSVSGKCHKKVLEPKSFGTRGSKVGPIKEESSLPDNTSAGDLESKSVGMRGSKVGPIKEEASIPDNTSAGDGACAQQTAVLKTDEEISESTKGASCGVEASFQSVCIDDDNECVKNEDPRPKKEKKVLKERVRSGLSGLGRRIRSFACVCTLNKIGDPEETQSMVDFVDITEVEDNIQKKTEN